MNNIIHKILTKVFLILFVIIFQSCMEDINDPGEIGFSNAGDLITYFETHGDFINSSENPALISADELYAVVDNSLLLDLRTTSEFSSGHIQGAINLNISDLIDTLEIKDLNQFIKIVIISTTGQKAAYAVSLLRLFGFTNIYSLNYGMGQWNELFAKPWIEARGDAEYSWSFKVNYYSKPPLGKKLPTLSLSDSQGSNMSWIQSRIIAMLTEEAYSRSIGTVQELDDDYVRLHRKFENIALICYSEPDLFDIKRFFKDVNPPITWGGHYQTTLYYNPSYDFKASTNLLTLPVNKTFYIYSYNGQRSQYITAYLRLLGYDARSVRFGAISMLYNKLDYSRFDKSFREEDIKNYPIVN